MWDTNFLLVPASISLCAMPLSVPSSTIRELIMLVGYGSGSGYDVYARVLANQFGRHLAAIRR
jgi:hypothetical protein